MGKREDGTMQIPWVDGFEIRVRVDRAGDGSEQVVISAIREGLLSLAKQMTAMAEAPESSHLHYDENNSLEQGSTELIVERIPYNRDGGGSV